MALDPPYALNLFFWEFYSLIYLLVYKNFCKFCCKMCSQKTYQVVQCTAKNQQKTHMKKPKYVPKYKFKILNNIKYTTWSFRVCISFDLVRITFYYTIKLHSWLSHNVIDILS